MKSSKAMDDYLAVERRFSFSATQVESFPTPPEVEAVKSALSEEEFSALRGRTSEGLGDYPEGWGPVTPVGAFWSSFHGLKDAQAALEAIKAETKTGQPTLATANLIRYEWHACVPDAERLNVLFADGWEFYSTVSVGLDGLTADTCILRREPRTGGATP